MCAGNKTCCGNCAKGLPCKGKPRPFARNGFVSGNPVDFSNYSILGLHVPFTSCPEDDPNYIANITANSNPDCGEAYATCYWDTPHWIAWWNAIYAANGNDQDAANATWLTGFENCRSPFDHERNIAANDQTFISFIKSKGIDKISTDLQMIMGEDAVSQTVGNALNAVNNAAKSANNFTASFAAVMKYLPWIALGVVALIIGLVLWNYFKGKSIKPKL